MAAQKALRHRALGIERLRLRQISVRCNRGYSAVCTLTVTDRQPPPRGCCRYYSAGRSKYSWREGKAASSATTAVILARLTPHILATSARSATCPERMRWSIQ